MALEKNFRPENTCNGPVLCGFGGVIVTTKVDPSLQNQVRNFAQSRRKLHKLVTEEHPRHFLTINLTIHEKNIFEKKNLKNGGAST